MRAYKLSLLLTILFSLTYQWAKAQNIPEESTILQIEIHTGDLPDAGTNDEQILNLFFEGREVPVYIELLDHINGNGLERSSVDRFNFEAPKLGKLLKISIRPKNPDFTKWYLNKIVITDDSGMRYKFECNCWVTQYMIGKDLNSLYPTSITNSKTDIDTYVMKVTVKTSDRKEAGTNANVYLKLTTEYGNGTPIKLNSKIHGNAFEQNEVDLAFLEYDVFKELKSIIIRHDNKGIGSGWHLEYITVSTYENGEFRFNCNCWMEGDNNVRKLFPEPKLTSTDPIFLQSRIADKYLDVQWGNSVNGTPLHLWPSNKGKAQQFFLEKAEGSYYYIRSGLSNDMYLHVANSSTASGAKVVLMLGKGSKNSKWLFEDILNGYYLIKSDLGTYLDVQWGSDIDGTPIHMWTKNKGSAQQWRIMINTENGLQAERL